MTLFLLSLLSCLHFPLPQANVPMLAAQLALGGTSVIGGVSAVGNSGGGGGPVLVAHTYTYGTSGGLNTTGATLLVAEVVDVTTTTTAPTDSLSNTWTPLTQYTGTAGAAQFYYVCSPTTSSSQTFTNSVGGGSVLFIVAFSGTAASSCLDTSNGAAASNVSSLQTGSITPSATGELLVAGVANAATYAPSINDSFTLTDTETSYSPGSGVAYLVDGAASAINPTWSISNNSALVANIAAFKHR
jgi:hypothetical protein